MNLSVLVAEMISDVLSLDRGVIRLKNSPLSRLLIGRRVQSRFVKVTNWGVPGAFRLHQLRLSLCTLGTPAREIMDGI